MSSNQPITTGDRCQVIWGAMGKDSPNIGLIVVARQYVGDHSQHGRIWRCEAEYAHQIQPGVNVRPGMADFAQAWLKKLPPDATPATTKPAATEVDHP